MSYDNVTVDDIASHETLKDAPKKEVSIDEMLVKIGEFKRSQISLTFIISIMMIASVYHSYVIILDVINPLWKCSENGRITGECQVNGTLDIGDQFYKKRCSMNKTSWEYVSPERHSIISEVMLSPLYCFV